MRANQHNRTTISILVLGLFAFALSTKSANADSVVTYTGNPYTTIPVPSSGYSTANSITATLTFANPLPANASIAAGVGGIGVATATDPLNAFVITDGTLTFNLSNTYNIFLVTGSSGQIVSWFVGGCAVPCGSTINIDTQFGVFSNTADASTLGSGGTVQAYNAFDAGTWTPGGIVPTPEPSSLLMGLLGLAVPIGKKFLASKHKASWRRLWGRACL